MAGHDPGRATALLALTILSSPSRAELYAAALVVPAINVLALRMELLVRTTGWVESFLNLFGISAIVWFALYALIRLGVDARRGSRPRGLDWLACAVSLILSLIPTQGPPLVALVALGTYLFVTAADRDERAVAIVGLALTGPLLWGPLLLRLLGDDMLSFDAAVAAFLSGNTSLGNLVVTPGPAPDVLILPGCSALRNVAPVFVLAAALSQLTGMAPNRRLAVACLVAVVAVIATNSVRLALIATYPQHYTYLHEGGGATLFSYANMLVVVAIISAAIVRDRRHAV
ncbi:MAG: hypothetical protein ABIT10_06450 [Alteraurantiacibacter sp.]